MVAFSGISIRCVPFPVPSISCTKTGEDDFSPEARETAELAPLVGAPLDRNAQNAAAVRIETTALSANNRSKSIRLADRSKLSKRKL